MELPTLAADAQSLLTSFAEQLTILGIAVPPAQYVASGIVPWDGESLTISIGEINQGQPGAPFGTTWVAAIATVLYVTLNVQILREVPALEDGAFAPGMTPDPTVLGESGQSLLSDASALVQAAIAIHGQYLATGPGEGFVIGPCQPLGPDGGLGGMRLLLGLSLA